MQFSTHFLWRGPLFGPRHILNTNLPIIYLVKSPTYYLNPSVHWRLVHGFCIVLDVTNDRYISIPAHSVTPLLTYLSEVDGMAIQAPPPIIPSHLLPLIDDLVAAGVLTREQHNPSTLTRTPHPQPPARVLKASDSSSVRRRSAILFPGFLAACVSAHYSLNRTSLRQIVSHVANRRAQFLSRAMKSSVQEITDLTCTFHDMRPLYPHRYLCIFDSLALLNFLAQRHIFPKWVFGVSADPFEAHCWVQFQDIVLCDTIDFSARRFTPILTI